jgi:hypothetical protein
MVVESPDLKPAAHAPAAPDRRAWLRLLAMVALGLCGLFVVIWHSRHIEPPPRRAFDSRPLRQLRRQRPNFVLIGNSMVGTRFDTRQLNRLLNPRSALVLARGGSYSASWYLTIKNHVVASGVHPARILLFFRGTELTEPRTQSTGPMRARIEPLELEDEPLLEQKLRPPTLRGKLAWWLSAFAPTQRLETPTFAESSGIFVSRAVERELDDTARKATINGVFDMTKLRTAATAPDTEQSGDEWRFEQTLPDSLLPEIVSLCKENGSELAVIRIRTRDAANGVPESKAEKAYIQGLKQYLQQNGVEYADTRDATWEEIGMYGNGDHIAPRAKAIYTRLFVENLPHLFR